MGSVLGHNTNKHWMFELDLWLDDAETRIPTWRLFRGEKENSQHNHARSGGCMATYSIDWHVTGTITTDDTAPPIEPPPVDPPVDIPPPDYGTPADVSVGPTREFKEPADAYGAVPVGGIMEVDDGTYTKSFHAENPGMTIRSASGNPYKCVFDGQGGYGGGHKLAWGKGMIHSSTAITLIGLGFRSCGSPASGTNYANEAGVWIGDSDGTTPGTITVQRCAFDNNANGVFSAYDKNLKLILIENLYGYIASNGHNAASEGQGGGPAHDNYVGVGEVDVSGCMFWGTCGGHNVKSRSANTNVHDNPCMTQDGGRVFELPDGGSGSFKNNVIHTRTDRTNEPPQGTYGNANMIAYCSESSSQGTAGIQMSGNTIHVSRQNSTIWANAGTIISSNDTVHYYSNGSLQLQGNIQGLSQGSAPPGSPSAPPLPKPPAWAGGGTVVLAQELVPITEASAPDEGSDSSI
jgi:hypothetical protein